MNTQTNRTDVWIALGLGVLAVLIFYPFASLRFDAHHDGIMLKPALDVLSGQVLFRDTFTQYGPLTTYLQALALGIDPRLVSIRVLTVLAQAGALSFFYLAWRSLVPRGVCLVAAAVFIAYPLFLYPLYPMQPWSSTLALFFQSVALLGLLRLIAGGRSAIWGWVLGAACACVFWCRQPVGVLLIAGAVLCAVGLWITGWSHPRESRSQIVTRVIVGGLVVSVLILGHLGLNGALADWWQQNVIWPRKWAVAVGEKAFGMFMGNLFGHPSSIAAPLCLLAVFFPAVIRRLWSGLPQWVEPVWWLVLSLGYWVGLSRWMRDGLLWLNVGWSVVIMLNAGVIFCWVMIRGVGFLWKKQLVFSLDYHLMVAWSAVVLASLPQIFPMTSGNHVFWAVAPGIGLLFYAIYRLAAVPAKTCALGLLIVFSLAVYEKYRWGLFTAFQPWTRLESPAVMRGIKTDRVIADAIRRADVVVCRVLRVAPDVPVVMYGDDALYLCWFNNRQNPTPLYVTWPMFNDDSQRKTRWNYLLINKPVVLVHGGSGAELKYLPADYKLALDEPLLDLKIMLPDRLRNEMSSKLQVSGGVESSTASP
jgi:hypothetical protein